MDAVPRQQILRQTCQGANIRGLYEQGIRGGIRRAFGGIRSIFGAFGFCGSHGDLLLVANLLAKFRPSGPFIILKGENQGSG